jgi:hypothetical protein
MMAKHTEAINVLKDELEDIVARVKWLRAADARFEFAKIVTGNNIPAAAEYEGWKFRQALKVQLRRGKSIMASIKILEGDN